MMAAAMMTLSMMAAAPLITTILAAACHTVVADSIAVCIHIIPTCRILCARCAVVADSVAVCVYITAAYWLSFNFRLNFCLWRLCALCAGFLLCLNLCFSDI